MFCKLKPPVWRCITCLTKQPLFIEVADRLFSETFNEMALL